MTREEKLILAKKFMEANGCREVERHFSGEMSGKYIITLRQIVHFADTVNHTPDAGKMVSTPIPQVSGSFACTCLDCGTKHNGYCPTCKSKK